MAKDKNTLEGILGKIELVDRAQIIESGLQSATHNKKAGEERDKYATEGLTKDAYNPDGSPRYTPDAFGRLTEDEKKQKISEGYAFRQGKSLIDSIKVFAGNTDETLKDGDKYSKKLVDIAYEEIIMNSADDKDKPVIFDSRMYSTYKSIAKDLDAGKPMTPELKENLKQVAYAGAAKKKYDELKDYPEELRQLGSKVAVPVDSEITPEHYKTGIKELIGKEKKNLVNKYGDEFEGKIAESVGKTLVTLVKSSKPEKEQAAIKLLYKANKGYGIGERDFKEVYK